MMTILQFIRFSTRFWTPFSRFALTEWELWLWNSVKKQNKKKLNATATFSCNENMPRRLMTHLRSDLKCRLHLYANVCWWLLLLSLPGLHIDQKYCCYYYWEPMDSFYINLGKEYHLKNNYLCCEKF